MINIIRFGSFVKMFESWHAPAVVVFYGSDVEVKQLEKRIYRNEYLRNRKNIVYHIVYRRQVCNALYTINI